MTVTQPALCQLGISFRSKVSEVTVIYCCPNLSPVAIGRLRFLALALSMPQYGSELFNLSLQTWQGPQELLGGSRGNRNPGASLTTYLGLLSTRHLMKIIVFEATGSVRGRADEPPEARPRQCSCRTGSDSASQQLTATAPGLADSDDSHLKSRTITFHFEIKERLLKMVLAL